MCVQNGMQCLALLCCDHQFQTAGPLGECVVLRDVLVEIPGSIAWSDVRDIIDYLFL